MALDISLVNKKTLVEFCGRYGIVVAADDEVEDVVAKFDAYVQANVPIWKNRKEPAPTDDKGVELYQASCDVCGGFSSVRDERCPYCGSEGDDLPKPKAAPKAEPKPDPEPAKAQQTADKKKRRNAKAKAPETEPAPGPQPVPTDPKPEVTTTPVPELDTAIDATPAPEQTGDRSPVAADVDMQLAVRQYEELPAPRDIDEAIERVRDAKSLHIISHWHFGRAILACFQNDLWKQKRDEKGNPRYKGFGTFCEAELRLSARYCYSLMEISAQFGAADVSQIGVAKLGEILKVAPAQRAQLLEQARGGKPLTEIAKAVQKLVAAGKGNTAPVGQGKRDTSVGTKAAAEKALKEREAKGEILTATYEKKRVKVELFCKDKDKRAKRLADSPVGQEVTLNGVTCKYTLSVDSKGELLLIIERKRAE